MVTSQGSDYSDLMGLEKKSLVVLWELDINEGWSNTMLFIPTFSVRFSSLSGKFDLAVGILV